MLVKCINNIGDSRLKSGNIYEVNIKILHDTSCSLINMPGKYKVNRFLTSDNEPFTENHSHFNTRYNPELFRSDRGYVIPNIHKIKLLKNKLYKIIDVALGYEVNITTKSTKKVYKRIKVEGYDKWFNAKNFYFYSDEEALLIFRDEKIEQITKKISNE